MTEASLSSNAELVDLLSSVELFAAFQRNELEQLAEQAESHWFEFGEVVCETGEPCAGPLVVRSGAVRLFVTEHGRDVSMGVRKQGEVVAEIGALRDAPHGVSVRASSKTELLLIPRTAIAKLLASNKSAASYIGSYVAIRAAGVAVNRLFNLKGKVGQQEMEALVGSVGIKRIAAGEVILQQGEASDRRLYVVRQGTVSLQRSEDGTDYVLGSLQDGDLFGERSALKGNEQFATATAQTDAVVLVVPDSTVKALAQKNDAVENYLTGRIEALEREVERQKQVSARKKPTSFFDVRSKAGLGERVLQRFQLVEQAEEMDCGAACLSMISKHYGLSVSLGKLREMANVTTDGATMDSLAKTGEALGFTARGLQCTFDSLLSLDLPFIAHWEGYHYIVVYGVSKNHVWVADPARGFAKMSVADFEKGWSGTCLTFTPGVDQLTVAASSSPWIRFTRYLTPFKSTIGYVLLATLVVEILGMAPPIIVQNVLDRVVVHSNINLLNTLMIGLVLTQLFMNLTTLIRGHLSLYLVRNLDFAMISQFFKHTMSLPLSFFDKRRTGDIFARFQENQTVRNFMTESTISTLLNVLMVFLYFIVLFMYSAKLTGIMLAMVVPIGIMTLLVTPKIKAYARATFEASTDAEAVLMETISGAETVKAMAMERPMRARWETRYVKALQVQYRAGRFDIFVSFLGQLFHIAITVVLLWLGASMVLNNELTIGQLIAFNMLMGSALSPLMGLISLWDEIQETGVSMERLGDVLDLEPEESPDDLDSRIVLPQVRGEIEMKDVYFRYDNETPYVLAGIDLKVEAGQVLAIVGQSGSGKTTMAKLIAGFYTPNEGIIRIDGYDMAQVDKESYRSQLGYVMQDNLLFSGSVAENIAAGDQMPDKLQVTEAAKLADAHGFISNLPLGYDQVIGERGTGLSGGQMQRLCIARALYKDPKVVILDEATSALDSQSENNILQNMQTVLGGRTAIVIAHRLSTIMSADKIVVLYEGSIVEEGTHDELLARGGMYQQLISSQLASAH